MTSYESWNDAIVSYFTAQAATLARVYLSVDDKALRDIGSRMLGISEEQAEEAFLSAVREHCTADGDVAYSALVHELTLRQDSEPPLCVAFLASMVYAAYHMGESDQLADHNYFGILARHLDLTYTTRPPGLEPPGCEVLLWDVWEHYLTNHGFVATAKLGTEGGTRYTNLPLSQALLRHGDRESLTMTLAREISEGRLHPNSSRTEVAAWFRSRSCPITRAHLRRLSSESDPERFEACVTEICEVLSSVAVGGHSKRIVAELCREEDWRTGEVLYWAVPRRPMWMIRNHGVEVTRHGEKYELQPDRAGWFRPLFPVDPGTSETLPVEGDPDVETLVVPTHRFTVLGRDPFDPEGGSYGPWERPGLGVPFLLLARSDCKAQMEALRQEGLIAWGEVCDLQMASGSWLEYHGCMAVANADQWRSVMPIQQDLFDALKPSSKASLSFQGGLRVGRQNIWVQDAPPEYKISAFNHNLELVITELIGQREIFRGKVPANEFRPLPISEPGTYEVSVGGRETRASLRLIGWEELQPTPMEALA